MAIVNVINRSGSDLSIPSFNDTGGYSVLTPNVTQLFTLNGGIQTLINQGQLALLNIYNQISGYTNTGSLNTPSSLGVVATINVNGIQQLNVEAAVVGQSLTAFQVLGQVNNSGTYQLLYSTSSDYTSPKGLLIGTSGDLTSIASGTSGFFQMTVRGFYNIQIKVTAASTGGTITILSGGL